MCRSVVEDLRWQLHLQHRRLLSQRRDGWDVNKAVCTKERKAGVQDRTFYITCMVISFQDRITVG